MADLQKDVPCPTAVPNSIPSLVCPYDPFSERVGDKKRGLSMIIWWEDGKVEPCLQEFFFQSDLKILVPKYLYHTLVALTDGEISSDHTLFRWKMIDSS